MGFKISTKDLKPEDMDGDKVDPGWYFATLTGVKYREKDNAALLTFTISGPLAMGKLVGKTLGDGTINPDREKGKKQWAQARVVAMRLGLLTVNDAGKEDLGLDFEKAIGWNGVVEMEPHSFEGEGGKLIHTSQMGYPGMYPLNHEKIPVAVREALGMPLLAGQVPSSAPKPETAKKGKEKAAPAAAAAPAATPSRPLIDPTEV